MEIVVALAVGDQCQHEVILGGVGIGVGLLAPGMAQAVDKESNVVADHQAQNASQ